MSHIAVVAIDFGTTFSGWAYSFLHEYQSNPLSIHTYETWNSGVGTFPKTSTCILFDASKNFHSFGFDAEQKYEVLASENKHHDWYYFRRFKMMLYDGKGLKKDTQIEDNTGKKMEAMKVFSESLLFLKDHFLQQCIDKGSGISNSDIKWVITVPAIWNDSSKQFMREAGIKAGISEDQMMIALEPEAASLYCMRIPVEKDHENSTFGVFKTGSKYMVVDAGGGTIDIIVHEVQKDGTLKEIHKANGGNWGGTVVDSSFMKLLADIMGKEVIEEFTSDEIYDLLNAFEIKKRNVNPDQIIFSVPGNLKENFCQMNPCYKPRDVITLSFQSQSVTWNKDKLILEMSLVKNLFDECCKKIIDHMHKLFKLQSVKDVPYILLVGGFAEATILQKAVRDAFHDKKVIVPVDAGLAVLKGAVLYGHQPACISGRICKYTYGIRELLDFDPSKHPKSKKVTRDGKDYCSDVFDIHVHMDDLVELGKMQAKQSYVVVKADQKSIGFPIYSSSEREPTYTTDKGCIRLGTLTLDMPDTSKGMDRGADVHMNFGGTEITVTAVDKDDPHKTVSTKVDFLG